MEYIKAVYAIKLSTWARFYDTRVALLEKHLGFGDRNFSNFVSVKSGAVPVCHMVYTGEIFNSDTAL